MMIVNTSYGKCSKMCTREYRPICGRSSIGEEKVFGNPCLFNLETCENPRAGNLFLIYLSKKLIYINYFDLRLENIQNRNMLINDQYNNSFNNSE